MYAWVPDRSIIFILEIGRDKCLSEYDKGNAQCWMGNFEYDEINAVPCCRHLTGSTVNQNITRPSANFYQTRSAWSIDQGSTRKRSVLHSFAPTVTKFCVMWEGLSLPHDTKFGNCRGEIVDKRVIFTWSLIHGSNWSGLIKVGPKLAWGAGCGFFPNVSLKSGRCSASVTALQYQYPVMIGVITATDCIIKFIK